MAEPTPQEMLTAIRHFITDCDSRAADGEEVSLDILERGVDALCQRISRLPAAEMGEFKGALQDLAQRLDTLAGALQLKQHQVKAQVDDLERRRKASLAYKVAGKPGSE
ncbi:MAG: hypothetical protein IT567_02160 [Alphaproteobacteria bacterium]|nr:hypothetical protein [Alphaproteobacteria bacterium]